MRPGGDRVLLSKASARELHQRMRGSEAENTKAPRGALSQSEGLADSSEPVRRIGLGHPLGRDPSRTYSP